MTPGNDPRVAIPPQRRRKLIAAISLVSAVVLLGVAAAAVTGPLFRARTVHVRGEVHLSHADVLRIAGIVGDTNVFTFDAGGAELKLERDPWIAHATVTKDFPSTLVVAIRERVPVAVAEAGGVPRLVAQDGTLLDAADGVLLLPRIASADPGGPELSAGSVRDGARALAAMTPRLRRDVAAVSILADGGLRVDLSSGAQVTYGPAVDLVAKAAALQALLRWATKQGTTVASADVEAPTAPTAHLVSGTTGSP